MQLEFKDTLRRTPDRTLTFTASDQPVSILVRRRPNARRYILRVDPHGRAFLTIPRRGSFCEGQRFVEKSARWLEQQLRRVTSAPGFNAEWMLGTGVLFRGEWAKIEPAGSGDGWVKIGDELIKVPGLTMNLRPAIERHIRHRATCELRVRVEQLAALNQLRVNRVSVRNQRSRWGSCSRKGTISLNWRLIQTPPSVTDYVILHELMHLLQMNHSPRFWRKVEQACPNYRSAEQWLKQHSNLLR